MWLPTQLPIVSSRLIFKLYDYDRGKSNEIVASMKFDVEKYLKIMNEGGEFPIFWKNLYGAPLKVSGSHTNKMNENPEIATCWKGRILMQVIAEYSQLPTMKMCPVDDEALIQAEKYKVE